MSQRRSRNGFIRNTNSSDIKQRNRLPRAGGLPPHLLDANKASELTTDLTKMIRLVKASLPGSPNYLGTIILDDIADTITVDLSWAGLTSVATAAHIHGPATPGVAAPVFFNITAVPNTTSGTIGGQLFSITPAQITDLENGLFYFNSRDASFPAGEIRGQIYETS